QSAIQTDLPESGSDNEVSIDDVLITMKVTGGPMASISVNDSSVSESELIDRIKTEMGSNKKKRVVIAADKDLSYDEVVKVLAKLQAAKISNVALATKKGE
ncbi:MAG: ExbD/TolR family protein, partial [Candidatus Sericytochromatia bacterium]